MPDGIMPQVCEPRAVLLLKCKVSLFALFMPVQVQTCTLHIVYLQLTVIYVIQSLIQSIATLQAQSSVVALVPVGPQMFMLIPALVI